MDRLAAAEGGTLTLTVVDPAGEPADLDDLPGCQVVDPDGDPLGPALTVTTPGTGSYRAAIPAGHPAAAAPLLATADWTCERDTAAFTRTTSLEVIGSWPFTLAQLRAVNDDLADPDTYPAAVLAGARDAALTRFEQITGVAWTPRWRRRTVPVAGNRLLLPDQMVHHPLLAVTVDGDATWTPADLLVQPWGEVAPTSRWFGTGPVTVTYRCGYQTTPQPVVDAVLDLAVAAVIDHGRRIPDRTTALTTDLGTFRVTVAGRDGPTGIPSVDAVAAQYSHRLPAVG